MGKVSSFLGIRKKNWSQVGSPGTRWQGGVRSVRGWREVTPGKDQGASKWPEAEKASLIYLRFYCLCLWCHKNSSRPKNVTELTFCVVFLMTLWLQVLDSSFYPHCEFTFMDGIRWSNFLFCMRLSSFPNTPHWRTSCLFPIIYSGSFALICHVYMSTSGLFILSSWSTCLFLFQYILFQWLYLCNMLDIRKQDAFHFVVLPQDYFDSQGLLWFHSIWSHWLCRFRVLWTL